MPSGVITFVSETYKGSISDRKLVESVDCVRAFRARR